MPPASFREIVLKTAAVTTVAAMLVAVAGSTASAQTAGNYSAHATGTVVHADALRGDDGRALDAEVSFSGASLDSDGYGQALRNEVGRIVSPASGSARSAARGAALEAGLNVANDADNQLIVAGKAEASAPGGEDEVVEEFGPLEGAPLAYASLLTGRANAMYLGNQCVLGGDASRGSAAVADLQLLETGETNEDGSLGSPLLALGAQDPQRATVGSISRTRFVAQTNASGSPLGDNVGLMSETRMTILPLTFFGGTESAVTIEVLGEWVLRAVATGLGGGAWVHYGPADASPETPVLRIIRGDETDVLLLQDILGDAGRQIVVPGLGEIVIGEDARAIGGDYASEPQVAGDGTSASAAVDVVRIRLMTESGVSDLRVGHMEAAAAVPAGGITCSIPVTKDAIPDTVPVGDPFVTDITITNPYECDLQDVSATDDISTNGSARYRVNSTTDGGVYSGDDATGVIDWGALGVIDAGKSKKISAGFTATAGPGEIIDTVVVTGTCGVGDASGTTTVQVAVTGTATATVPVTGTRVLGVRDELPATGVPAGLMVLSGATMVGAGVMLRRFAIRGA